MSMPVNEIADREKISLQDLYPLYPPRREPSFHLLNDDGGIELTGIGKSNKLSLQDLYPPSRPLPPGRLQSGVGRDATVKESHEGKVTKEVSRQPVRSWTFCKAARQLQTDCFKPIT
jgi:hypothetical protein